MRWTLARLAATACVAAVTWQLTAALPARAGRGTEVTVYAASSLGRAFRELSADFTFRNPGYRAAFTFDASSALRQRLQDGDEADVFASADWEQMRPLEAAGRVTRTRVFARSQLAVVLTARNTGRIRTLADLARPGVRVAMTAAEVPIAGYTRRLLARAERAGHGPAGFGEAVARNVVESAPDAPSLLVPVLTGLADAAVVYETDLASARRARTLPLPAGVNITTEYVVAPMANAPQREGAAAFVQYLTRGGGSQILRRHGFR